MENCSVHCQHRGSPPCAPACMSLEGWPQGSSWHGCLQSVDDLTTGIANGYIVAQVFYDIFVVRACSALPSKSHPPPLLCGTLWVRACSLHGADAPPACLARGASAAAWAPSCS